MSTTLSTATCRACTCENAAGARYCRNCGRSLEATLTDARTVAMTRTTVVATPLPKTQLVAPPPLPPMAPTGVIQQRELTIGVIDNSSSMSDPYDNLMTKIEAAKRGFCSMILQKARIDPNDEAGLISFNDHAMHVCPLLQIAAEKQRILSSVQSLSAGGGTDINEGLKAARDMFDWSRRGLVRRIVLLTDGHGGAPLRTSDDLRQRGVVIDVIGVGESPADVDEKLLRKVASVIGGETRYRFIKKSQTLVSHYTSLASKTQTS